MAESAVKRIGVLTSGGDAPGMNAAVRSVVRSALDRGIECIGIRRGWSGLINGDFYRMDSGSVSRIINRGGTILYTARSEEFRTAEGQAKAAGVCKLLGLDGIVAIGGDGTFRGAQELSKCGVSVVGIPHQMSVVKEICTHVAILDDGEVVENGLVSAVFSAPKSQAARHLVFPGGADAAVSDPSQERRIRLIFRSAQTTAIPMVARLAAEESIYANVISASTQKLSEEVYGSMLLGIPNSQFDRAWQFFRTIPNLQAEEVSVDVQ